jgi:hypothetical protein
MPGQAAHTLHTLPVSLLVTDTSLDRETSVQGHEDPGGTFHWHSEGLAPRPR